ncbi:MAG TPA: DNA repair protein RadA [Actinocrinis sp.]|uniref:DNA repair protein RadA n=1 Tax=Actinocrinis sp. TaxID=1920516 RepID=UPI002DDD509A|nr:DNA repair protein RadA [Actinocrinis sp.]HEV2345794.1 DNA repair protein RadA [Actinocrinis sp.]
MATTSRSTRTAAPRDGYRCVECGATTVKWVGRCPECQAWGSVEEVGILKPRTVKAGPVSAPARPIDQVDAATAKARPTGVPELDRVLGGGIVPGAVILLAGEPGVGKSTLLLEVAAAGASPERPVLVVTGEESTAQVRLRADRIGALDPDLYLAAETDLAAVLGHIEQVRPSLLILDSVQTVASAEVDGVPGGATQVREVSAALIRVAKERDLAVILVGHVTKDGSIAGPRVLEHLVDVVLQFEGDRHSPLRLARAVKNRYGPTDEIGCFEMHDSGIRGLADPSGLFLSRRSEPVPGTCVTVTLEGRRPLVCEVQALVAPSNLPQPRRATSGLDGSRVSMVMAVLERRGRVQLGKYDVFAATVGGVRLIDPAADLAVALAMTTGTVDSPLPATVVAFGEVGLAGEVRPVTGLTRRLSEAARLGFRTALVPRRADGEDVPKIPDGMHVVEIADIADMLANLHQMINR